VSHERREQPLVVKGELEAQAPKGAPADPFAARQAKAGAGQARARANAKASPGR
jgi:hypothetical protein